MRQRPFGLFALLLVLLILGCRSTADAGGTPTPAPARERILSRPASTRVGFSAIHAKVSIDADMTPAEKEESLHEIDECCAISGNLQTSAAASVKLAV